MPDLPADRIVTLPEWAELHRISSQRAHQLYAAGRLPVAYPSGPAGKRGTILLPRLTPFPRDPRHPDAPPVTMDGEFFRITGG